MCSSSVDTNLNWLRPGDATLETLRRALYDAGFGQTTAELNV